MFCKSWFSALATLLSLLVHLNVETVPVPLLGTVWSLCIWWNLTPSFLQHLCPSLVWLKWGGNYSGMTQALMPRGPIVSGIVILIWEREFLVSVFSCPLKAHLKCSEEMSAYHIFRYWYNKNDAALVWNWDKKFMLKWIIINSLA